MGDEPGSIERGAVEDPQYEPPFDGIPVARPIPTSQPALPPCDDHALLLTSATRGSAWVDIARVILMVVALDLLGNTAMYAVAVPVDLPEDVPDDALRSALFAPMLVTRVLGVILSVSVILWHRGQTLESIGLAPAKWKMNLLVGIGATGAAYGFIFAWQMTMWYVWPGLLDQMNENADRIMALVPKPSHPIGFVPLALAVGIYEEILFRGFLLTRLRRGTGGWVAAVVISTAVFTSLHAIDQMPAALVPVAMLSVVFSLVTIWRRSLIPAIVGHFLFNLFNMIGLYYIAGDSWT